MSSITVSDEQASAKAARTKVIQPAWVRALHWTNAFAMVLMIMSGWKIYNASPLFGFTFSDSITLGGWLGGALLWHFAAISRSVLPPAASARSCCRSRRRA